MINDSTSLGWTRPQAGHAAIFGADVPHGLTAVTGLMSGFRNAWYQQIGIYNDVCVYIYDINVSKIIYNISISIYIV